MSFETLKATYEKAGQGHVFQFYDSLNEKQKASLLAQLTDIEPERANSIFRKTVNSTVHEGGADIQPLPEDAVLSTFSSDKATIASLKEKGMKAIATNKVGVILLAGGQGTRLGSSAPKGCYDIGLPSKKSLFQLQGERIRRLETLATAVRQKEGLQGPAIIPWYVMTSGPTHSPTMEFFEKNKYFGMKKENVIFFQQGVLPAFTNDGKFFMAAKDEVSVAPDGNGGIYAALRRQGVLKNMKERGVEYLHTYCVDNCLVKVADPLFIGYCINKGAECGAKVVRKLNPEEPVGIICLKDSKFTAVEYSEIPSDLAKKTKANGELAFGAANIANHFYTLEFLNKTEALESQLAYHVAKKKIKHVDLKTGECVTPKENNGMKMELFVFDVFPFVHKFGVLEVDRKEDFSPLKNAPGSGSDCPETSRRDIIAQHIRFIEQNQGKVMCEGTQPCLPENACFELSPLLSYEGEGLECVKGMTVVCPAVIETTEQLMKHLK